MGCRRETVWGVERPRWIGLRWTPTYIKSDAEGYWCDPYWGCYVVGDAQYATQFDINGGVTFRF